MAKNLSYKRFADEQIYKANNISIMDYINSLGLKTKRAGKTVKIEGYGGLYIDPVQNKWNCFSERKGGGPIQLVMHLDNINWVNAVKKLLGNNYENQNTKTYKSDIEKENKVTKRELVLPKKNTTYKHMIAYLTKTRGIDIGVVQEFINNKILYEDDKRNCVFVGYDKNKVPRYASLRGTNTNFDFKGEAKNSNKAYSFNLSSRDSDKLYVFESPIEIMSYLTLYKLKFGKSKKFGHNALSLGGTADTALGQFLKNNKNITEIYLCLNNDKAGILATEDIIKKYESDYKIEAKIPQLEDYNDLLIYVNKGLKKALQQKTGNLENNIENEEYEMEI